MQVDEPQARESGLFTKLILKIAGVDEKTLRQCPPHDWDNARAVGGLMICTWLYQAVLFFIISHRLFAAPGQIRPELVLASMFIATFIMMIDSYMVMRSGWHLSGIEEVKRGGLDISGGPGARIKAGFFLAIRILLSIGIAQLTAIFLSLIVFGADISARVEGGYLQANTRLIADATALVDANIKRATDAVNAESARTSALAAQVSALRQNEIDPSVNDPQVQQVQQEVTQLLARQAKAEEDVRTAETFASNELGGIKGASSNSGQAGNGPRHRAAMEQVANAKNHAQEIATSLIAARSRLDTLHKQLASKNDAAMQRSHSQLPTFEDTLARENAQLSNFKDQLASLTRGREDAIRKAVENAPGHVNRDDGFLAQIVALEHIAESDSKIAAVILLIDLTSFGFELASVLAKVTSFVPTTYAALLAHDAYMRVVRMVNGMIAELNGDEKSEPGFQSQPLDASDNRGGNGASFGPGPAVGFDDPTQPTKRPRGRPRKSSLH